MSGNDSNTVVLLHGDGSDTSTTITNSASGGSEAVTAVGDAQLDTAKKKFGTASILMDGTGDHLTIGDHADFDFSGGEWTIDFWIYPNDLSADRLSIYSQETDSSNRMSINVRSSGEIYFFIQSGGITLFELNVGTITTGSWQHVAIVENGNNYYVFIDGALIHTEVDTGRPANMTGTVYIGRTAPTMGGSDWNGWFDEFRISDVARWTSAFTPQTVDYDTEILAPNLFTNLQTFYTPITITSYTLIPSLFTNSQIFYDGPITYTYDLTPSLFTNIQSYFTQLIENIVFDISPDGVFTNTQIFYSPTVTTTYSLTPSLFTNSQVFYDGPITTLNTLIPDLFTNTNVFFSHIFTGGQQFDQDWWIFKRRRRMTPSHKSKKNER